MDNNEARIIEYTFPKGYRVPWLEEILKEFKIETKESWYKENDDWFEPEYTFDEPDYPDLYSLTYTCLPELNNFNHEFAEMLIEFMLQVVGNLEECLRIEIDNKKGDTS